jgi:hypothetical protein
MQQMFELLLTKQTKMKGDQDGMEAARQRDRENLQGMMAEMNANLAADQAQMRSTLRAFHSKMVIQRGIKAAMQPIRPEFDETHTC